MLDAKQATNIAKEHAKEALGDYEFRLEEIERELYHSRDVWSITLSFPSRSASVAKYLAGAIEYKKFLIDSINGEPVAMKLRELEGS